VAVPEISPVLALSEIPVGRAGLTVQSSTAVAAPKVAVRVVVNGELTVALGSEVVEMSMYSIEPVGVVVDRENA
jgi:hypothetical protein